MLKALDSHLNELRAEQNGLRKDLAFLVDQINQRQSVITDLIPPFATIIRETKGKVSVKTTSTWSGNLIDAINASRD